MHTLVFYFSVKQNVTAAVHIDMLSTSDVAISDYWVKTTQDV